MYDLSDAVNESETVTVAEWSERIAFGSRDSEESELSSQRKTSKIQFKSQNGSNSCQEQRDAHTNDISPALRYPALLCSNWRFLFENLWTYVGNVLNELACSFAPIS